MSRSYLPPTPNRALGALDGRLARLERRLSDSSTAPRRRAPSTFVTVAAVDTPPELAVAANFQCDGVDDDAEVSAAVNTNAAVVMLGGNYVFGATVVFPGMIRGEGIVSVESPIGLPAFHIGSSTAQLDHVTVGCTGGTGVLMTGFSVMTDCYIWGDAGTSAGIVTNQSRVYIGGCLIQVTGGDSVHLGGNGHRVEGLLVTPSQSQTAGTVVIEDSGSYFDGTFYWPSTASGVPMLNIQGDGNIVVVACEAYVGANAVVVNVSGNDNVVVYAKVGSFGADVNTGTNNKINAWGTSGGGGGGADFTFLDAAGDLLVASAADTPARLAIGSTGHVLTVAGGTATWAAPPGAGTHTHGDADIPATIARDSEVTAAISTHAAATDPHTGYATDADLTAHAATPHGGSGSHPDLAAHDTLGLATQAELDAHAATAHGGAGGGTLITFASTAPASPTLNDVWWVTP